MFKQFPPVTKNLLILNTIVFLIQMVCEQRGMDLADTFGLHFILASDFSPIQLVTYMFLHGSFSHLFFNMFSLWMFGRIIEQSMGMKRFLIYWFVCGIGAGLCQEVWQLSQYYIEGMNHYDAALVGNVPIPMGEILNNWTTIGASGACYGVLLAFGMAYPNERIMLLIPPIPIKAKYFVAGYAAIEVFAAFGTNTNIAHFAHLGGMLFGFFCIRYWRKGGFSRRKTRFGFSGQSRTYTTPTPRGSRTFLQRIRDGVARIFGGNKAKMEVHEGGKRFKDRDADYNYNKRNKEEEERIDKILEKIKQSGYESLTQEEKRLLFDHSRR